MLVWEECMLIDAAGTARTTSLCISWVHVSMSNICNVFSSMYLILPPYLSVLHICSHLRLRASMLLFSFCEKYIDVSFCLLHIMQGTFADLERRVQSAADIFAAPRVAVGAAGESVEAGVGAGGGQVSGTSDFEDGDCILFSEEEAGDVNMLSVTIPQFNNSNRRKLIAKIKRLEKVYTEQLQKIEALQKTIQVQEEEVQSARGFFNSVNNVEKYEKEHKKEKQYVMEVSGYVRAKEFSKLWVPEQRYVFGLQEDNVSNIVARALKTRFSGNLGLKNEWSSTSAKDKPGEAVVSETFKPEPVTEAFNLFKFVAKMQEAALNYGVSYDVRAAETRVLNRLFASGLFQGIFSCQGGDGVEKLRKALREHEPTYMHFAEVVGLYLCWNSIIVNGRSVAAERDMMKFQFDTAFEGFVNYITPCEREMVSNILNNLSVFAE